MTAAVLPFVRRLTGPTLVERVRASFAARVDCTPFARRVLLRQLAVTVEDEDPDNVPVMVAALSDPSLPDADRAAAWQDLLDNVELAGLLFRGVIEPCEVAPHAQAAVAYTVASEVIETDVAAALRVLVAGQR